jgi:hypothetical protein
MGAVVKLDRLEKIYSSREAVIEKLNEVSWSYAYPVTARYTDNTGTTCAILALGTSDDSYEIISDSATINNSFERCSVYFYTRTSWDTTDDNSISAALFGSEPKGGDVCIISTKISGVLHDRSGFIYNSERARWEALGGVYDAGKVILRDDIELNGDYENFGGIKKSQGTWKVSGMSLQDALKDALDRTLEPEISQEPEVTLTATFRGDIEVGSIVTQGYTISLTAGKYSCAGVDQDMNASVGTIEISFAGETIQNPDLEGSLGEITVGPGYSETITAQVQVKTDTKAVNNKGTETDLIWGPKIYSLTSEPLKSFRNGIWYGALPSTPESWESSDALGGLLRENLKCTGKEYTAGKLETTIKSGDTVLVIALEKGKGSLSRVLDAGGNEEIALSNFTEHTVIIPGASGGIDSEYSTTYTLYEYAPIGGPWLKDIDIKLIFT